MDVQMFKFTIFLSLVHLATSEITEINYEYEAENEISDTVKEYVSRVISDITEKYDNRIQNLETTIRALQQTTDAQKRQIRGLKMENRVKHFVISKLGKRTENLETKCDILKLDIETKDTEDSEKGIAKHRTTDDHKIKSIKQKQTRLKRGSEIGVHVRRTDVETRVAFFAYMSSDSPHLGKDQDIVFDHAVTNIGNAYNERHGNFIAPVAGTYVFSVTLGHFNSHSLSHDADAYFVVNSTVVARLYMSENLASQTIVVNLKAGNDVSLHNRDLDEGLNGYAYSTFSGFLLYEYENVGSIVG